MNLCIVQKEHLKTPRANIKKVLEIIPKVIDKGADVICFSEWFLGTNPPDQVPNKFTNMLSEYAKNNNISIITGNFRIQIDDVGKKFIQMSLVINNKGEIILKQGKINLYKAEKHWFIPGEDINYCELSGLGKVVVTSGLDSTDIEVYNKVKELKPSIWVAQANEFLFNNDEVGYDKLVDIYKERSLEMNCTIVVPMILGSMFGAKYEGRSFIIKNGELVSTAGKEEELLFYDI
ncbi:carbon-nitrogen hydrolase family protein [Clostridium sporogenes]|uniref:carbon-nitrogen hydrolase family protein n=1 Tax=Clostridium sporogenes TaxID=1509 RepID=UPI0006B287C3|nr:carbon-nitrogen hydrolase family protein [Clostridium sporogenes]KOY65400.1 hypothetical protein AN649_13040 [Clostridium sporogenes]MDS1006671.1 carbon-nitrogen hydrolase family protein [Clostridium sporogenes]